MYICYGPFHSRIAMSASQYVLPEQLYEEAARYMNMSCKVHLEFELGSTVLIHNKHELALACRVVSEHHNAHHSTFDDDGWIQETSKIWENMLFADQELTPVDGSDCTENEEE